ncbi:MAG: MerC family mercury resistance protein [Fimbriimonadaceae bacterium]|nr:MerC family mercury resistance protein [Alphaproteobacteria bacterium]
MSFKNSGFGWVAGVAMALSLAACYGTLAVIGLLGALGIAIALNETLWAGAIVTFATLSVGGLGLGLVRHRQPWPILVGGLGAIVLGYTMYAQYDRWTELAGFVLLSVAAFWDWRLRYISARTAQAST